MKITLADTFDGPFEFHPLTSGQNPDTIARKLLTDWTEPGDTIERQGNHWYIRTHSGDLDIHAHLTR